MRKFDSISTLLCSSLFCIVCASGAISAQPEIKPQEPPVPAVVIHEEPIPPGEPGGPEPWLPDRPEPESVEKIRKYTTAPEFLPESVSYVPDSDTVPSPTKVLNHLARAPDEL